MAKQITGGKLYLTGGHQLTIAAGAVDELVEVLRNRSEEVSTVTIVPGNQLMVHWSQIAALQIFSAGTDAPPSGKPRGTGEYRG
ncbi:MAG: hypothetical protein ABR582_06615 [Gemmatimonadaceae bacterium]